MACQINEDCLSEVAAVIGGVGIASQVIDKIKTSKEISEFLRDIGEKISALGSFGGKGSNTWKAVNKTLKDKKSKLLQ